MASPPRQPTPTSTKITTRNPQIQPDASPSLPPPPPAPAPALLPSGTEQTTTINQMRLNSPRSELVLPPPLARIGTTSSASHSTASAGGTMTLPPLSTMSPLSRTRPLSSHGAHHARERSGGGYAHAHGHAKRAEGSASLANLIHQETSPSTAGDASASVTEEAGPSWRRRDKREVSPAPSSAAAGPSRSVYETIDEEEHERHAVRPSRGRHSLPERSHPYAHDPSSRPARHSYEEPPISVHARRPSGRAYEPPRAYEPRRPAVVQSSPQHQYAPTGGAPAPAPAHGPPVAGLYHPDTPLPTRHHPASVSSSSATQQWQAGGHPPPPPPPPHAYHYPTYRPAQHPRAHPHPPTSTPLSEAWFALGEVPPRQQYGWSRDRLEGYHAGWEDALRSVEAGVFGIGGHQYARPILVRKDIPPPSVGVGASANTSAAPAVLGPPPLRTASTSDPGRYGHGFGLGPGPGAGHGPGAFDPPPPPIVPPRSMSFSSHPGPAPAPYPARRPSTATATSGAAAAGHAFSHPAPPPPPPPDYFQRHSYSSASMSTSMSPTSPMSAHSYSASASASASAERKQRQPISCYPCRGRKLKCDGEKPCSQCVRRGGGGDCEYASSVRRRGKGRKAKSADGEDDDSPTPEGEGE